MFYIPVSSVLNAEDLSRKLFQLSRPLSQRSPDDITQFYSPWLVHPITSAVLIQLPESDTIPINIDAEFTLLDSLFQPFVDANLVPATLIDELHTKINNSKGQEVNLYDLLPDFWKSQAKTYEQVISEGYFS